MADGLAAMDVDDDVITPAKSGDATAATPSMESVVPVDNDEDIFQEGSASGGNVTAPVGPSRQGAGPVVPDDVQRDYVRTFLESAGFKAENLDVPLGELRELVRTAVDSAHKGS